MFQTHKRGFALPSAIFALVVFAILGVALLFISTTTNKSSTLETLETKAFFAAKAGVDYGVYKAVKESICNNTISTIDLNDSHFVGFKSSYSCELRTVTEGGLTKNYYKVTSYGCNTSTANCPEPAGRPTNEDYTEKSITIIASDQ